MSTARPPLPPPWSPEPPARPARPSVSASPSTLRTACLLSAVALAAGSFFEWLGVDADLGLLSATGIECTNGWFTLGAGAAALWATIASKYDRAALLLTFGLGVALSEYVRVKQGLFLVDSASVPFHAGAGLYICLAGGVVGGVAAIMAHVQRL